MLSRVHAFGVLALLLLVSGCGGMDGSEDTVEPPGEEETAKQYVSHPARIYVDERGGDWTELPVRHAEEGDASNGLDLERLWVAHSPQYLFLRIEVGTPINLQEDNALTLSLDTDTDADTGQQVQGMGAELRWAFGDRSGEVTRGGETRSVEHDDLGFSSLPTVQSETFEVALDRSATPTGSTSLLQGDSLRIALSTDGDQFPDADGGLGYVMSASEVPLESPSLDRPSASDVRLLSYNSVNDFDRGRSAIFQDDRQPSFRRIFEAVGPDVIAFQEVYDQSAVAVDRIEEDLGLSDAWVWAKQGQDLVLGSRYPILESRAIPGYEDYESGAYLLDAQEALGHNLLVLNMHPPCCNFGPEDGEPSSNAQRQQVADGVAAFLRDVTQGEGPFDVAPETPIVVLGDMNFVGDSQQPRTLRTGDIVNNDRFGADGAPDWDDSPLLDTRPQQTGTPMHVTWDDASSSFPPGRLDYAYVSDSVLEVVHEFVLYTPALSEDARAAYGLQAEDTRAASDHLPVVIDVAGQ